MLTRQELRSIYKYKDGFLYHKNSNNHVNIGDKVGYYRKDGYLETKVNGKCFLVHRLIYAYFNNEVPKYIDHKNCIKDDNRIENLRPATWSQNQCNKRIYRTNSTGVKGVSFKKDIGKYVARLQTNGKRVFIGCFDCLHEAENAINAQREKQHGLFNRKR